MTGPVFIGAQPHFVPLTERIVALARLRPLWNRCAPRRMLCGSVRRLACSWLLATALALWAPFAFSQEIAPATTPQTITVGVLTDNYPFSYLDADGQIKGFVVDLLAEIERVMALRIERTTGTTQEINRAFEEGRIDLLQTYTPSPERLRFAAFSQPYVQMSGVFFVRKSEQKIHKLSDLRGRRVMVHPGSKGEEILRTAGLADSIVHVESVEQALRLLDQGVNDATLAGRLSGLSLAERDKLAHVIAVGDPLYQIDYCFAAQRSRSDIIRRIDEGVLILKRPGGSYKAIYRKWFGELGGYSRQDVFRAVAVGLSIALIVAVWALFRQRSLHQRLARQAGALKASEERYRSVFEASADAMLVLGPPAVGGTDFRIEQANPNALRLLKSETQPPGGMLLSHAFPEGEGLCGRIVAALAAKSTDCFEHKIPTKPHPLWLRVSASPLGARTLVVLADITGKRAAEARLKLQEQHLRQQQKLEAIGTMASGVAHDFNNILTGIVGNAELAGLDLPAGNPASRNIAEILAASERARKLTRQILTFSRQSESRPELVDIVSTIEETLRFLSVSTPQHIEVHFHPPPAPCVIEADPTQIHQVLLNLCTNAIQAIGDTEGSITLSARPVAITQEESDNNGALPEGSYVHIVVKDTGCGMSPEVQQRIFEPFFTTKPVSKGTGLGLSVAHGIVKQHGGDISVYSRPGEGTAFSIRLPLHSATAPEPAPSGTHREMPRGRGEHVLIIDDDPSITQMAQRGLTRIGYRVTTYNDPLAAVEAFTNRPGAFDVIVSDFSMSPLNGIQVAERIGPGCPFILISGYLSEKDRAEARARGITRILEKPIHLANLAQSTAESLQPYRP